MVLCQKTLRYLEMELSRNNDRVVKIAMWVLRQYNMTEIICAENLQYLLKNTILVSIGFFAIVELIIDYPVRLMAVFVILGIFCDLTCGIWANCWKGDEKISPKKIATSIGYGIYLISLIVLLSYFKYIISVVELKWGHDLLVFSVDALFITSISIFFISLVLNIVSNGAKVGVYGCRRLAKVLKLKLDRISDDNGN